MFERNIYDHYQLYCESRMMVGGLEGFEAQGDYFVFIPREATAGQPIQDSLMMADHIKAKGDLGIPEFVSTMTRNSVALVDGVEGFLFKLPPNRSLMTMSGEINEGIALAEFHMKGKQFPLTRNFQANYFGHWKIIWEKRLDQLERWYQRILSQLPQTEVDEAFIISFPYYMGLTENAIQYVTDTDYDEPYRMNEQPVICHQRYKKNSWLCPPDNSESIIKLPTDFVVDHPSRDLAEWLRYEVLSEEAGSEEDTFHFIQSYETINPISNYGWRLMYARLLFPLHYFEVLENYYGTQLKTEREMYGEQFFQLLDSEYRNQKFLQSFHHMFNKGNWDQAFPKVDWLHLI